MTGSAIGKSMNYGFPGNYARTPDTVIMNRPVKSSETDPETEPSIPFGHAVILNTDNTYSKFEADGTMAKFAGIAVRNVKQASSYSSQNTVEYDPLQPCDVLQRGSVSVMCNVGTPTSGGKVYIRVALEEGTPAGVIGGLEATDASTNTIELTNCRWATGLIDSNKVTEMAILNRNNP